METESPWKPLPWHNLCQRGHYSSPTATIVLLVTAIVPSVVQPFYTHSKWVIHTCCARCSWRSNPLDTRCCPLFKEWYCCCSQWFQNQYISIAIFMFTRTYHTSQQCSPLLAVARDSCKNKAEGIGWMPATRSAWWKICRRSKVMENLRGKGALQCRKLRYNKARRGEATPQCEVIKKIGCKVKATCHLWSFVCIRWLARHSCRPVQQCLFCCFRCGKPNMAIHVAHELVCSWTAETHLWIVAWLCAKESSQSRTANINTAESITFC